MSTRIGFTGDVMLGRNVDKQQYHRPVDAIWDDVLPQLRGLDGLIINLECCLSTRGQPWRETYRPFHFRADPEWAIPALTTATVDVCSLANNHILDYEKPALVDTIQHLDQANIAYSGAGRTSEEALQPAVVSINALDVAVVSLTDNTPEYAAGPHSPGTAHIEIDSHDEHTIEKVQKALSLAAEHNPDLLVASLHWGPNMVEEPPESFREFGRWLIDRGVDVIHGHSAHVFQAIEVHEHRPICYDMGDFIDDYTVDDTLRNDRSFLYELIVTDSGRPTELKLHPIEIRDYAVHHASVDTVEWCHDRVHDRTDGFETTYHRDDETLIVDLNGQ